MTHRFLYCVAASIMAMSCGSEDACAGVGCLHYASVTFSRFVIHSGGVPIDIAFCFDDEPCDHWQLSLPTGAEVSSDNIECSASSPSQSDGDCWYSRQDHYLEIAKWLPANNIALARGDAALLITKQGNKIFDEQVQIARTDSNASLQSCNHGCYQWDWTNDELVSVPLRRIEHYWGEHRAAQETARSTEVGQSTKRLCPVEPR